MGSTITGWGIGVPGDVLASWELAQRLDLDESWIIDRTGILSRRIATDSESSLTLAIDASRSALDTSGRSPSEIDMIVVATSTPDHQLPGVAPLVQDALGADRAAAFDLNAGCCGYLYGLAVADSIVTSGLGRRVLVCGTDVLSRHTDPSDPKTAVLFGDGAGATVVEHVADPGCFGPFRLYSDGSQAGLLGIPSSTRQIEMQGREVYRWAVEKMTQAVEAVLLESGSRVSDVALLVGHQANARILVSVAERLQLSDRALINIGEWGNTSAASIPIALAEAADAGRLQDGDLLVLTAFGAGFLWGAGMLRWGSDASLAAAAASSKVGAVPFASVPGLARMKAVSHG